MRTILGVEYCKTFAKVLPHSRTGSPALVSGKPQTLNSLTLLQNVFGRKPQPEVAAEIADFRTPEMNAKRVL